MTFGISIVAPLLLWLYGANLPSPALIYIYYWFYFRGLDYVSLLYINILVYLFNLKFNNSIALAYDP